MTNHSQWCIKEPSNNCVNCCQTCSNCEEEESEDEMSEQTNYPKRGCMSEDGKHYTHTDGSVHEQQLCVVSCKGCSLMNLTCHLCNDGSTMHPWRLVAGAYVLSDEELAACDMARKMILECCTWMWGSVAATDCGPCLKFADKTCPARVYLASKKQADAREVKP